MPKYSLASMTNKTRATALPIAFKPADRALLQTAAAQLGMPESTYIRQMGLAAARKQLEAALRPSREEDE